MKIFVAFGYNERDVWVKEMVFPIIESFDFTLLDGKETFGGGIGQDILDKIDESDFVLAFTTQRFVGGISSGQTSKWVLDEISAAVGKGKPVVEVRELELDLQDTFLTGTQKIYYQEKARDKCLVEITTMLAAMRRKLQRLQNKPRVRIQLLPKGWAHEGLRPLLDKGEVMCEYVIRKGSTDSQRLPIQIDPISGGLFIEIPNIAPEEMIRIFIKFREQKWQSDYESINAFGIHLNSESAPSWWQRLTGK